MADQSTSNDSKAVLIVAIDFGTTYSRACWSFLDTLHKQNLVNTWPSPDNVALKSDKVPTKIAYETEGQRSTWGFQIGDTERRYQEFKLLLDKTRKVHHSSVSQKFKESASLPICQTFTPKKLTTDFLKHLRACVERDVDRETSAGTFELSHTGYVITVPAIWSDDAKSLTKTCAHDAGLLNAKLITEPEAAMVYVLQYKDRYDFSVGDTYMICDAGGGTVDLITYQVTSILPCIEVEEVAQGNGDRCGSVYITRQFHQYVLSNHAKLVPFWTEEQTSAAVECFENKTKRKFDNEDLQVVLKVPGARDCQKGSVNVKKQKVFIPAADIKAMFDTICTIVASLVKEQRSKAATQAAKTKRNAAIKAIILVGGFGESPYLQKYLRNEFSRGKKGIAIIKPENGWSAVVRGALNRALPIVKANHTVPCITARQARRFYGITLSQPFNPYKDPESKKFLVQSDGKFWIERIFWFLAKGKAIKENYEIIRSYEHSWKAESKDPKDTTIMLKIVSWDSDDEKAQPPLYPDAPGIEKVNNLNVDLSVIPKEDLTSKSYIDTTFYECYPDVRITYHFATIQYQLYIGEKCYGEVQSGFED